MPIAFSDFSVYLNEEDRRYIYISITKEGKEFLDNHKALVMGGLKAKLANIEARDLQRLASSLQNIKEILNKIE